MIVFGYIFIPGAAALIQIIYTFGIWKMFIKPIENSNKVSEKNKLILQGIIAIGFSVFLTYVVLFMIEVIFHPNFIIISFY